VDDVGVKVTAVGVQYRRLPLDGGYNCRVFVANVGNVVDGIQKATAGMVVEVLARTAKDGQRAFVGERQGVAKVGFAGGEEGK
jgi:hypothetical protein